MVLVLWLSPTKHHSLVVLELVYTSILSGSLAIQANEVGVGGAQTVPIEQQSAATIPQCVCQLPVRRRATHHYILCVKQVPTLASSIVSNWLAAAILFSSLLLKFLCQRDIRIRRRRRRRRRRKVACNRQSDTSALRHFTSVD